MFKAAFLNTEWSKRHNNKCEVSIETSQPKVLMKLIDFA